MVPEDAPEGARVKGIGCSHIVVRTLSPTPVGLGLTARKAIVSRSFAALAIGKKAIREKTIVSIRKRAIAVVVLFLFILYFSFNYSTLA